MTLLSLFNKKFKLSWYDLDSRNYKYNILYNKLQYDKLESNNNNTNNNNSNNNDVEDNCLIILLTIMITFTRMRRMPRFLAADRLNYII